MSTTKPRYSVTLDDELFQKVEDFRFKNRFQNRNDATVALIRRGLESIEKGELPTSTIAGLQRKPRKSVRIQQSEEKAE